MTKRKIPLRVIRAGRLPYDAGLALQSELERQRLDGSIPDTVVVLEHEPVITLGHRGEEANVVAAPTRLRELGIEVRRVSRGGDVTYHGPGQVVLYPIVDLRAARLGAAKFIEILEGCMISVARDQGLVADRIDKKRGVFVGSEKLGAVGIHISHGITTHGLALNVDPDLTHFDLIISCGLREHTVTSLRRSLGRSIAQGVVERGLLFHLAQLLRRDIEEEA